ncbi:ESPR-type extended signal peptide-containing protein [Variovorax sp. J31P207]|nr:ESPR-type extended signal peptide-containing protein [Variovorax sp. J31P207]MDM0070565.1 ESPR-type extended signal peptide-containing protein [Variovorax sp. J31P207]
MNKIYRVFRDSSGKLVVASELAKANRKQSGGVVVAG